MQRESVEGMAGISPVVGPRNWGGRTRTSNFQIRAVDALSTAPSKASTLAAAERKIDPETVTEPSSGSAPSEDR
jgi:hypothetical protein